MTVHYLIHRNQYKIPFSSPELQPIFYQHLWLSCILLKKRGGGHLAHKRHSISIFEWKTEEMFCEHYPHLSVSKHQENSTNIQKPFRSQSIKLLFSPGLHSFYANKWRGWLGQFHALPHCSVLWGTRADTEKQWQVPPQKCVQHLLGRPEHCHNSLVFTLDSREACTLWVFSHVCSSVKIKLDPLDLMGWMDLITCYASCVCYFSWKRILRVTPIMGSPKLCWC